LPKINNIHQLIKNSGKNIELQVDGGINLHTAPLVVKAGANVLVAGSYVFSSNNYASNIANLKEVCVR
jgi:ribulose-phosphate 3-epimerase